MIKHNLHLFYKINYLTENQKLFSKINYLTDNQQLIHRIKISKNKLLTILLENKTI